MESPFVIDMRLQAIVFEIWCDVTATQKGKCQRLAASQDTLDACYHVLWSLTNYTFGIVPADDEDRRNDKINGGIGFMLQIVMQIMQQHAGLDRTMHSNVMLAAFNRVNNYLELLKQEAREANDKRIAEWRARVQARQAEKSS